MTGCLMLDCDTFTRLLVACGGCSQAAHQGGRKGTGMKETQMHGHDRPSPSVILLVGLSRTLTQYLLQPRYQGLRRGNQHQDRTQDINITK
jgi:hypothetical protein